jgi:SPP1 gp7 family putative phage head morphogenesis protein
MTSRHLERIERETGALVDGAVLRGALAMDRLADQVLEAVRRYDSLTAIAAALKAPETLIDQVAVAPLLTALLASMVTGDLLGRFHVTGELRSAPGRFRFTRQVETAFPGQTAFAAGMLGSIEVEPLPPEEAIALFRDKIPMTRSAFDRIIDAYRGRAFTIAGQQTTKAVSVVQGWLDRVLEHGLTLRDFRDGLQEAATAGGITAVNPYHAATVFETNVQTAYNAGRYEMYHAPEVAEAFPFFQYHTVGDDRVRPAHAQMDGFIAKRDDPVWDIWWPPCGFNCRCTVTAISAVEADRDGIRPSRRQVPQPDPGFAGNAAKAIRTAGLS